MRRSFLLAPMLRFASALMFASAIVAAPATIAHAQSPADRAFPVFFATWSGDLDDSAVKVIADVAVVAKANPGFKVIIRGYADPSGTARANALVSALRAELVANLLVIDGVPAASIEQDAMGATEFALSSQESRRVTLSLRAK